MFMRGSIMALMLLSGFSRSAARVATITVYSESTCSSGVETQLRFSNSTSMGDDVCQSGSLVTTDGDMGANFKIVCNGTFGGTGSFYVGDDSCSATTLTTAGGALGGTMTFTLVEYDKLINERCAKGVNNDGETKYMVIANLATSMLETIPCGTGELRVNDPVVATTTEAPTQLRTNTSTNQSTMEAATNGTDKAIEASGASSVSLGAAAIALVFFAIS